MHRENKHVTMVKVISVPCLFKSNSKSSFCTPKSNFNMMLSTKSKSKSLKKEFKQTSSIKTPKNLKGESTPKNFLKVRLKQEASVKQKQKKVILIKNSSVKNLSTTKAKSFFNRSNQSNNKLKDSGSKHLAPSTSRSSTYKQQEQSTLFSHIQVSELNEHIHKVNPYENSDDLSEKIMKKKLDVFRVLQNLDQKFKNFDNQIVHRKTNTDQIRQGVVHQMKSIALDSKQQVLSLLRNKIMASSKVSIDQNTDPLFQPTKINKVYVNSYKTRNG